MEVPKHPGEFPPGSPVIHLQDLPASSLLLKCSWHLEAFSLLFHVCKWRRQWTIWWGPTAGEGELLTRENSSFCCVSPKDSFCI